MAIITYEQWYDLTYERFNWRGSELSGVDNGLKAYHLNPCESTARTLKSALDTYIVYLATKNGADWEKSSRNAKGGIVTLRAEVDDLLQGGISEETRMLRALLIEHRYSSIVRLFGGRKIVIKAREMPPLVQTVKGATDKVGLMADALGLVADIVKKVAGAAASPTEVPAIIAVLGNQFLNNMALAAIPFVGGAVSAAKGVQKGVDAVQRALQGRAVKTQHIHFVLPGNAMEAAQALVELLRRRRNESAQKAGIYTASAALQIAGNFFPGGQLVGSASKIAESFGLMVMDAYIAAQEIKEIAAANLILSRGAKDLCTSTDIFKAYPLIGAYFVKFGDTNDILSVLSREIGTLHWREVVADIKQRHLEPMRELSLGFMLDSRFELQGMHVSDSGFLGIAGKIEKAQEKLSGLIDAHVLGHKPGSDFVRAAQPFIASDEAKAAVQKKAKDELQGRKAWSDEDLGRKAPVTQDTRTREQIMADLRAPIASAPSRKGGSSRLSDEF
ncbi:MAG: hypothetical protein IV100_31375 [Myxococcales bacterium]|nr:hypothetical protein [Myxococcales bacterium]